MLRDMSNHEGLQPLCLRRANRSVSVCLPHMEVSLTHTADHPRLILARSDCLLMLFKPDLQGAHEKHLQIRVCTLVFRTRSKTLSHLLLRLFRGAEASTNRASRLLSLTGFCEFSSVFSSLVS